METHSAEQLGEFLELWRRPEGVLSSDQLRALIVWSGTPDGEREALQADLDTTEQVVSAKPLAPNERRGHNSFLDRVRGFFR